MARFSAHFGLSLAQPELDFADVILDGDLPVYVDPFAISLYDDDLSHQCNDAIVAFFQVAINAVRADDANRAEKMLQRLSEPNETRLGVSSGAPRGRGISGKQAFDLYKSIAGSEAARSGLVSHLSECDLFIDGIGPDKISDMTTNIIRRHLIEYTQNQCELHNTPTLAQRPGWQHPDVLEKYKKVVERVAKLERKAEADFLNGEYDEHLFAQALIERLMEIPAGNDAASAFHELHKGIIEFLFWPNMINPQKEREINEGRKRIDILFTNSAQDGFFYRVLHAPQTGAMRIPVECKNYSKDPANPEVDQLSGRFAPNRGWLGFLIYRTTTNYELLLKRCRDTAIEKKGFIIPLGDLEIIAMLESVADGRRENIDYKLAQVLNRLTD